MSNCWVNKTLFTNSRFVFATADHLFYLCSNCVKFSCIYASRTFIFDHYIYTYICTYIHICIVSWLSIFSYIRSVIISDKNLASGLSVDYPLVLCVSKLRIFMHIKYAKSIWKVCKYLICFSYVFTYYSCVYYTFRIYSPIVCEYLHVCIHLLRICTCLLHLQICKCARENTKTKYAFA